MKTIAKRQKGMTRRDFLKTAGITGVGLALLAGASALPINKVKAANADAPGQLNLKKGKITPADRLAAANARKGKKFVQPALVAPPAGGTQGTTSSPSTTA